MAPRHKLTTKSVGMQKGRKHTFPPKNANSRQLRSSTTVATKHTSPEAFQKASELSQNLTDRPQKAQKRQQVARDEQSQKRLRKAPPSTPISAAASQNPVGVSQTRGEEQPYDSEDKRSCKQRPGSVPESQLSKENLKKLEEELETLERGTLSEMDPAVTIPDRGRKRAPSRQASSSDLYQDTASLPTQKPSVSNSFYRYNILARARIYVHPEPPPKDIQAQIDIIFKRAIPEQRRREISGKAETISQQFIANLRAARREDDLVEIVYKALDTMDRDMAFAFQRKTDWEPSLKPDVQKELWNGDALDQSNNKADDVAGGPNEQPNKRQQRELLFPSPDTSRSMMPPPPVPCPSKQNAVKTPRPDITVGFHHAAICNALMKHGLSELKADDFLRFLQRDRKLCSDPTQSLGDLRFPILVIEGKAYTTGKTVFEAQNQAAVSGACMVNLRQQLNDLFEAVFSVPESRKTHLAFSICTEGPQIEFWVHYARLQDNVRSHYMNILRTCYGSLQDGLEAFLMDVERLMGWAKDEYLEEVADQLRELADHAAA